MANIDIKGLDKAEVLAALYNNAKPQGMGFIQFQPGDMSIAEARSMLARTDYFDYINGRVMKVSLKPSADTFDSWLYDRDNGAGAAERAIRSLTRA